MKKSNPKPQTLALALNALKGLKPFLQDNFDPGEAENYPEEQGAISRALAVLELIEALQTK